MSDNGVYDFFHGAASVKARFCMAPATLVTVLAPMRPEAYSAYLEAAIAAYADDNVASGRGPREGALERSRADFADSLPQGLATPDNYLFEIKTEDSGPTIGALWFAVEERHGMRGAFVYDLEVHAEYRRQGHARAAFRLLEPLVRSLGLSSIGLHVFIQSVAAQALYESLGYKVTSLNMHKRLQTP